MYPKIVTIIAALLIVPTFMLAGRSDQVSSPQPVQSYQDTSLTFDECRVAIQHTNFQFPSQGGVIIQTENGMYFVRTYLPGCENAAAGYPTLSSAYDAKPIASNPSVNNTGLTFNECRVPVYHTSFQFPPEGGVIINTPNGMYFVRTYLPGCENAAAGYPRVAGASTVNTAPTAPASQQPFVAPPTGIK